MIRIASIEKESVIDGEGWRYVIFTQGCSHNCKGCHNPQTHDFNAGKLVSDTDILNEILKNNLLDGITLSGGDPFFQADKLLNLVKQCKENGLTVWAYTGFIYEDFMKFINKENTDKRITQSMIDLLKYIDVLVDGPFIESERTLESPFKGSSNQRIIDVKKTLKAKKIIEYKIT